MKLKLSTFIFLVLLSQAVCGKIRLPAIISNNMVLQQRSVVPLWGKAGPACEISVQTSWNGQRYTVRSDADGRWQVKVRTPKAGGPYTITFTDGDSIVLGNILIGEVWVCSGQSNMDKPLRGALNQPILNSNDIIMHAHDSQLRLFHIKKQVSSVPLDNCDGSWQLSSPESASTFSAVGFQFAKKMQEILKVPVGIIQASWGGTPIKGWMDGKSLQPFTQIKVPGAKSEAKISSQDATCLFNAMIHPIAGYGIKGFIWYQGEWDRRDPYLYKDLMVAMVKGWREVWRNDSLPFYYVQIAPYDYKSSMPDSVPLLRQAQGDAAIAIPHSGMVVSMDVGNEYSIHPPDKSIIAKRLLYWALGDTYHWKAIAYESPTLQSFKIDDSVVTVLFDHADNGLTSFDQKITGYELAGKDKTFYPAEAKISGKGKVILQSKSVPHPVAVRYLFKDWAKGNLYNIAGLPVAPFRTDHW